MWHLSISNIAGIESGTSTIADGLNAVQASNWQGKSSLIAALEVVHGTATTITNGVKTGRVTLETADGTYETVLERDNGAVIESGNPLLTGAKDRILAEQFAFLDGANPVRTAVRNDESLEAVLTRPLEFEDIDEQITALKRERNAVDAELDAAAEAAAELPNVSEAVRDLEETLTSLREQKADMAATADDRGDESRQALGTARAERESLAATIENLESTVSQIEARLDEKRAELDELEIPDDEDVESEIADVEAELMELQGDISLIQDVYAANKRVVDEGRYELVTDITHSLDDDSVECWVCGTEHAAGDIDGQLCELDERLSSMQTAAETLRETMRDLQSSRETAQRRRVQKVDLESEILTLQTRLASRREKLATRRERLDEIEAKIQELEGTVAERETDRTDLESEIKYTETRLAEKRDERDRLQSERDRRELLEEERTQIAEEIVALRERKERTKRLLRESFDEFIEDVLDVFEPGFESARLTDDFSLIVARDGREVPLAALSEGEIELLGIVVALAGFEAYDTDEVVSVMLLDEVGGLSGETLSRLVKYLESRVPRVVTTAFPEQNQLDAHTIDPSAWQVVSGKPSAESAV